jgi:hypothetical protein
MIGKKAVCGLQLANCLFSDLLPPPEAASGGRGEEGGRKEFIHLKKYALQTAHLTKLISSYKIISSSKIYFTI